MSQENLPLILGSKNKTIQVMQETYEILIDCQANLSKQLHRMVSMNDVIQRLLKGDRLYETR